MHLAYDFQHQNFSAWYETLFNWKNVWTLPKTKIVEVALGEFSEYGICAEPTFAILVYNRRLCGSVVRATAIEMGDQGLFLGHVIPKILKTAVKYSLPMIVGFRIDNTSIACIRKLPRKHWYNWNIEVNNGGLSRWNWQLAKHNFSPC